MYKPFNIIIGERDFNQRSCIGGQGRTEGMSDVQTDDCGNNSNLSCTFNPLKWEYKNTHLVMLARRVSGGPARRHSCPPFLWRTVFGKKITAVKKNANQSLSVTPMEPHGQACGTT
jgi:hypothetical protein